MSEIVKVTSSDDGQTVVLPEAYRFDTDAEAVWISRDGNRIVLEPILADDAIDPDTGLTIGRLRELIQEGLDSGPDELWDLEEMKREVYAELAARRAAR